MAEKQKFGSAKRFGPRYGRTTKKNFAKIEQEQRKKHKCEECGKEQVKRVSVGIWHCQGCGTKFAGKAYTPGAQSKREEVISEDE